MSLCRTLLPTFLSLKIKVLSSPLGAQEQPLGTGMEKKKKLSSSSGFWGFFLPQIKKDGFICSHEVSWTRMQALQACPHCPVVAEPALPCWLLRGRVGLGDTEKVIFLETGCCDCSTLICQKGLAQQVPSYSSPPPRGMKVKWPAPSTCKSKTCIANVWSGTVTTPPCQGRT